MGASTSRFNNITGETIQVTNNIGNNETVLPYRSVSIPEGKHRGVEYTIRTMGRVVLSGLRHPDNDTVDVTVYTFDIRRDIEGAFTYTLRTGDFPPQAIPVRFTNLVPGTLNVGQTTPLSSEIVPIPAGLSRTFGELIYQEYTYRLIEVNGVIRDTLVRPAGSPAQSVNIVIDAATGRPVFQVLPGIPPFPGIPDVPVEQPPQEKCIYVLTSTQCKRKVKKNRYKKGKVVHKRC